MSSPTKKPSMIKSKERVQDVGEVFTPDFLVERMLDQFPEDAWARDKNWLEPTCGNGQFILGILRRKLAHGDSLLQSLGTTFGVDIMPDNVIECHIRIYKEIVLPYVRAKGISGERWKQLRWRVVCLVENNIRPTKDSLQEDFTKWVRFIDRPQDQQYRMQGRIEYIFGLVDKNEERFTLENRIDNRLFKELITLKRTQRK